MSELPGPVDRFRNGLLPENPVIRQLLGMCPTLAVTGTLAGALTMGLATSAVLLGSNLVVSVLRKLLRPHLRILVYTMTIATFVTVTDRLLAAYLPEMSRRLGPYVPLIIVNCIILSRAEVCASKQGVVAATGDALGMGLGFCGALLLLGGLRELLASGTLLGWQALPAAWPGWVVMALPPGAFITLGLVIAGFNWLQLRRERSR